jgi:hypothetical protein
VRSSEGDPRDLGLLGRSLFLRLRVHPWRSRHDQDSGEELE